MFNLFKILKFKIGDFFTLGLNFTFTLIKLSFLIKNYIFNYKF